MESMSSSKDRQSTPFSVTKCLEDFRRKSTSAVQSVSEPYQLKSKPSVRNRFEDLSHTVGELKQTFENAVIQREMNGSCYYGEIFHGRREGLGLYVSPMGTIHIGQMKDGHFNGPVTTTFFSEHSFYGEYQNGFGESEDITFSDGLIYPTEGWKCCTAKDRRFWNEICNGLQPFGCYYMTNDKIPRPLPEGTYDYGEGIYDPKTNGIYTETGILLRFANPDEISLIKKLCRKAWDEFVGPLPSDSRQKKKMGKIY